MNNKYKLSVSLYCLVISLGSIIPFVFSFTNPLQTSLDIVRTLSILATSIFALLYFDPFGLKKRRKEAQYELVLKILEEVVGKKIMVEIKDNRSPVENNNSYSRFFINKQYLTSLLMGSDSDLNNYLEVGVTFDPEDFINAQEELLKLKNNLWTPPTIRKSIAPLEFYLLSSLPSTQDVLIIMTWQGKISKEKNLVNLLNNEEITLRQILSIYIQIIASCERWLKEHSFSAEDLNL